MNSPLSEIWFQRKAKCLQCAYLRKQEGSGGNVVMRCSTVIWDDSRRSRIMRKRTRPEPPFNGLPYCIEARESGQPCGPAAALFKEKP